MTLDQCQSAARAIDTTYLLIAHVRRDEGGKSLAHLRWMVAEINNGMSNNKAMRWLGYIQGVLVARYDVPLEVMKELSRAAVTPA